MTRLSVIMPSTAVMFTGSVYAVNYVSPKRLTYTVFVEKP